MCCFSEDLLEFPCCLQLHLSATRNLTDMNSQKVVIVCLILHIKVCFYLLPLYKPFFLCKGDRAASRDIAIHCEESIRGAYVYELSYRYFSRE